MAGFFSYRISKSILASSPEQAARVVVAQLDPPKFTTQLPLIVILTNPSLYRCGQVAVPVLRIGRFPAKLAQSQVVHYVPVGALPVFHEIILKNYYMDSVKVYFS